MRRLAPNRAFLQDGWLLCLAASLLLGSMPLKAQTPDVSVRGVVADTAGRALPGAKVSATQSTTGFTQAAITDSGGEYYFSSLPRGVYTLNFAREGYQARSKQGVELAVGARHEENVVLTRIGEATASDLIGNMLPVPALSLDTLSASVSVVVDEDKILDLPLASRNIYSLFLLQPGVTSQGAIVRRGLSFSVNGHPVSSSNYLLDGTDNNDTTVTGPVTMVSAEAIQEFRMVESSFSAENGHATAFVAQVATRSGGNSFHGSLFEFLSNDKLNANTFENNSNAIVRPAFRQNQFGGSVSGPLKRNRTFFTSVLEASRLRFRQTADLYLPSSDFIAGLPRDSEAYRLLQEMPPLASTPTADPAVGFTRAETPSQIDTWLATERIDHQFKNTKDRLTGRYVLSSTGQKLSSESPGYPTLIPNDVFRAQNSMLGWTHSFNGGQVNDLRVGWNRENIQMPRPRSDVPILQVVSLSPDAPQVVLPGSNRQSAMAENDSVVQVSDAFSMRRGRSALTAGIQYRKNISNGISLGIENEALGAEGRFPDGIYLFLDLPSFANGQPVLFGVAVDRAALPFRRPDLTRRYRSNDFAAFIQNDVRLSRLLSLNIGLRYEFFGVMHDLDPSQDVNFYFGSGATIEERLANGALRSTANNPGDLKGRLYRPGYLNLAPSIGLAWDVSGAGKTVLRAGYSIAVDRVFDTVRDLRSNQQQVLYCSLFSDFSCTPNFAIPVDPALAALSSVPLLPGEIVQLDENLKTPYAQNWYAGAQQSLTPSLLFEVGHVGSVGRKLISRDVINRSSDSAQRLNPSYSDDTFISNGGNSNYLALQVSLRRRFSRGLQAQVSYTYSHAIDNQSDVFEGPRLGPAPNDFAVATFTRQFDPRVDRGNADFDQRHNLVFNAVWEPPVPRFRFRWPNRLLGGWSTSVIGAYRSGFPLNVIGAESDPATGLRNNRVDFLGGSARAGQAVPGGVQFLNPDAFGLAQGRVGTLGRGSIAGPGFWNYDFALLRNISRRESGARVQLRAEFYNLLNHANLSVPVTQYATNDGSTNPAFGYAYYGLNRSYSRFGDLALENPSRRIQLAIRISF
jgi:Carboxypeptidase regulatory-like domain